MTLSQYNLISSTNSSCWYATFVNKQYRKQAENKNISG